MLRCCIGCYDNETEILTEDGWKYFAELNDNDKVATLNVRNVQSGISEHPKNPANEQEGFFDNNTGKMEWQQPTEKQIYDNNAGYMHNIETEEGNLSVSEEHKVYSAENYLNNLSGYDRNLNGEIINNLPLNSESLTCLSNFDNNEDVVSINGEAISNTTIPKCFSGGNNLLLRKCLSNVSMILDSDIESFDNCLSVNPNGTSLISCPSCDNNLLIAIGKFSSERNLSLLLEENIFLFSNEFRGICQNRKNGWSCNLWKIVLENFFNTDSCSEQFHNLPNHNSCSFKSRGSTANFTILNNILINLYSHCNYLDSDELFKSFGLQKITDVYSEFNSGKDIYFLNSENKPVKVKSITKQNYSGKISGYYKAQDVQKFYPDCIVNVKLKEFVTLAEKDKITTKQVETEETAITYNRNCVSGMQSIELGDLKSILNKVCANQPDLCE